MIKKIFFTAILSSAFITSFAQQIKFTKYGSSVNYTGDTLVITGVASDPIATSCYVVNVSGSTFSKTTMMRYKLIDLAGTQDYYCWGIQCYGSAQVSPYNPWTTPVGDAVDILDGDSAALTMDYIPNGMPGVSYYRYYMYSGSGHDLIDSMDVKYIMSDNAGIVENSAPTLTVYPNPAKGSISVKAGNATGLDIKIVDMLGTVVYSGKLENATDKIDVSDYTDGIYFVTIGNGNKNSMITKKIIVRN